MVFSSHDFPHAWFGIPRGCVRTVSGSPSSGGAAASQGHAAPSSPPQAAPVSASAHEERALPVGLATRRERVQLPAHITHRSMSHHRVHRGAGSVRVVNPQPGLLQHALEPVDSDAHSTTATSTAWQYTPGKDTGGRVFTLQAHMPAWHTSRVKSML